MYERVRETKRKTERDARSIPRREKKLQRTEIQKGFFQMSLTVFFPLSPPSLSLSLSPNVILSFKRNRWIIGLTAELCLP